MAGCKFCVDLDEPGLFKPYRSCKVASRGCCDACLKVKQLESQIGEAKKAMDKLFEKHRELRAQMNRAHDPILLHVPPEIASSIFQFSVASGQSPLLLGAVCRAWRQIAWSTPSIWSSIEIDAERHSQLTCRDIAREWLDRSGQLPLSIRLCSPSTLDWYRKRKNEDGLYDLLDIINRHSNRWQNLDVETINSFFSHLCEDSQPGTILRTVRLQNAGHSFPPPEFRFPGTTPRPESVALTHFNLRGVDMEWDNATRAELTWFQVDDCLEVLKRAPKLRTCIFLVSGVPRLEVHFPIPSHPIVHDKIIEITCKFAHVSNYDESLNTFFNKTSFPGLTRFAWEPSRTESKYHNPELPARAILSFFQRSSCLLRELIITETRLVNDEIIPILKELPSLRTLELSPAYMDLYVPDKLFELIAETAIIHDRNEKGILLPDLQTLRYTHWSPATELGWEYIPDMFGALRDFGAFCLRPLKTVQIRVAKKDIPSFSHIDEDTLRHMLGVLELGLELEILDKDTNSDIIQASVVYHESIARKSTRRRSNR